MLEEFKLLLAFTVALTVALTVAKLTHSPYSTEIGRIRTTIMEVPTVDAPPLSQHTS